MGLSAQRNAVRGEQFRKLLPAQISVFMFALLGEGIELAEDLVDEPRMAHDQAALRQPFEKSAHQRAEILRLRKIIGAGKPGIEGKSGARGALAELRAQDVEQQGFRRAELPRKRCIAAALANPGFGSGLLDRRQERV